MDSTQRVFFRPYNNSATASSGHSEAFWTADVRFIFTTASSGRQFGVGTLVTVVWARDILVLKYGPLHFLGPPATVDLEVLKSSTISSPAKCINVGCWIECRRTRTLHSAYGKDGVFVPRLWCVLVGRSRYNLSPINIPENAYHRFPTSQA